MLHQGERWHSDTLSDPRGFGREYRNPSYYFWLFTAGSGTLRLSGRDHRFQPGTLAVADSGERHTVVAAASSGTVLLHAGFAMTTPERVPLRLPIHELLSLWSGQNLPHIDFPVQLNARVTRQLTELFDEYLGALVPRGMIHCFPAHKAMLDIFALLVEHVFARAEPEAAADTPLMRVRLEIQWRYDERLTLQELASLASLSPSYLCRAFHKAFGMSPLAYQQELRLQQAKMLLSTTHLRVGEVAASVGFQSVYHFSRLFRKRVGCTPTAYAGARD